MYYIFLNESALSISTNVKKYNYLHFPNNIHALYNFSKDNMFAIKPANLRKIVKPGLEMSF